MSEKSLSKEMGSAAPSSSKLTFQRLLDIPAEEIAGKRVLIRCDLNAPIVNNEITEDTRLVESLPGMEYVLNAKGALMVVSHRGRPTPGQETSDDTLQPMADYLSKRLNRDIPLIRDWVDNPIDVVPGEMVLLENCRLNVGEKQNDKTLSEKMAAKCDIYVNDAFGIAHRSEATTEGIAHYAAIACAGPLLAAELDALEAAVGSPKRPLLAVVGGAKVSTKLTVLRSLAEKVDHLIVGGGIANTFLLAKGYNIGKSIAEPALIDDCLAILNTLADKGGSVPLPVDVMVAKSVDENAEAILKSVVDVEDDDFILDIGPQTIETQKALIESAATIVWNGPMGLFEIDAFAQGTHAIAQAIGESKAFSVAGGGDTLAAIAKFNVRDKIDYVSTGGGAFLEFLEGKSFPAVAILEARALS